MGKPKPPQAPNPTETGAAQTSANISTAIANAWLGNVNEYNQDGSTVFRQTGTRRVWDNNAKRYFDIPTFSRFGTLSPQNAAIDFRTKEAQKNLAQVAMNQSAFLQNYLSRPMDLSNNEVEGRLMDLGRRRLDPLLARQDEALRTRLANQGIRAGSAAYDREMALASQGRNDAYNQLMLSGRGQALQEIMAERNQPLNEISALLSGSQVSQPQFMGANMPTIPTTDHAGIINQDFQNRMGIWQQRMGAQQSLMGGLLGFGGALLGLSDRRAKEDIEKVGKLDGHNLYRYSYKGDPNKIKHVGVMAQEVEKKRPDAVVKGADGLRRVDYGGLFGTKKER